MMYTVIYATEAQQLALLEKHLKPFFKKSPFKKEISLPRILSSSFSYDDEDRVGFVSLKLISGIKCNYQVRNKGTHPCFVEFVGFPSMIRYDISYPKGEMYDILQKEGIKAWNNFWEGGEI